LWEGSAHVTQKEVSFADRTIGVSKRPHFPFKTVHLKPGAITSAVLGFAVRAAELALTQTRSAPGTEEKWKGTRRPATAKSTAAVAARPRKIIMPPRASFRTAAHSSEFGQRDYKIYMPASAASSLGLMPLLVMLHGCGQTPDDFAKGTRMNALAEEFRLLVVYPAQTREADPKRCWNWFRPGDQGRQAGEPALLASLTRDVLKRHPVDPARVYVAGLSAGGSAALVLARAYPDIFAAVGVHSGLPVGAAQNKASAMMAMAQGNPGIRCTVPMPTMIFHGSDDRVVHARNGRFIAIRALEPFAQVRGTKLRRQVKGGRTYVKSTHRIGQGRPLVEHWLIEGSGHAWSGGSPAGRFVDPSGPDASREMVRFFLRHRKSIRRGAISLD
jgi:poly(hydroxyalkanoate) depolymerase family esterase